MAILAENLRLQPRNKRRRLGLVNPCYLDDMGNCLARLAIAQEIFDAAQQQCRRNILCIGRIANRQCGSGLGEILLAHWCAPLLHLVLTANGYRIAKMAGRKDGMTKAWQAAMAR